MKRYKMHILAVIRNASYYTTKLYQAELCLQNFRQLTFDVIKKVTVMT